MCGWLIRSQKAIRFMRNEPDDVSVWVRVSCLTPLKHHLSVVSHVCLLCFHCHSNPHKWNDIRGFHFTRPIVTVLLKQSSSTLVLGDALSVSAQRPDVELLMSIRCKTCRAGGVTDQTRGCRIHMQPMKNHKMHTQRWQQRQELHHKADFSSHTHTPYPLSRSLPLHVQYNLQR